MSKPKTLVNKATADDRNPPAGYILAELAQKSQSITDCQAIEELVLKKLDKNKPYVKYKALRIVKYMCDNGSPQWKRAWQSHTDKLRECQQYRGPPDQVYGDSPYQQVRQAAKEAMQAVFASTQLDNSQLKNRIRSINGESAYSSSGIVTSRKATFGTGTQGVSYNPNRPPAPTVQGTRPISSEGIGNTDYRPKGNSKPFKPLTSSGYNPAQWSHKNPYSTKTLDNRVSRNKKKRTKKTVGGNWGQNQVDDDDDYDDDEFDDQDEFPADDNLNSGIQSSSTKRYGLSSKTFGPKLSKGRRQARSDGKFEREWVDKIVKGSGVGVKIPQSELNKYVQQFENLSQDHVLEYLDEKLQADDSWKEQGKALSLIEALLDGSSTTNVQEYFQQSPEGLQLIVDEGRSILKKKANIIIEIIGLDDIIETEQKEVISDQPNFVQTQPSQTQPSQTQSQAKQEPSEENLLFFNNEEANNNDDIDGILSGLITEEPTDMFNNMNIADTTTTIPANQQTNDASLLLPASNNPTNDTTVQTGGNLLLPSTNQPIKTTTNTNTGGGMDDIFSGLGDTQQDTSLENIFSNQPQQATQNTQQNGGFAFVNSNGTGTATTQPQPTQTLAQQATGSGAGFSFIGGTQQQNNASNIPNNASFQFVHSNQQQQQQPISQLSGMQTSNKQMSSLVNTTNENIGMMNNLVNQMNTMSNMFNTGNTMNTMNARSNMNNMNNMNMNMRNMNMNNMNPMNTMNTMNPMNNMQTMNTGMGMGMNMNMNNMNNMGMTGMGNQMTPNRNQMNAMMMNNMNNFSGLTTTLNSHNPLNSMRVNDPFAAVMSTGINQSTIASSTVQTQKKPGKDLFSDLGNLKNFA